jgi:hypothetical protein
MAADSQYIRYPSNGCQGVGADSAEMSSFAAEAGPLTLPSPRGEGIRGRSPEGNTHAGGLDRSSAPSGADLFGSPSGSCGKLCDALLGGRSDGLAVVRRRAAPSPEISKRSASDGSRDPHPKPYAGQLSAMPYRRELRHTASLAAPS